MRWSACQVVLCCWLSSSSCFGWPPPSLWLRHKLHRKQQAVWKEIVGVAESYSTSLGCPKALVSAIGFFDLGCLVTFGTLREDGTLRVLDTIEKVDKLKEKCFIIFLSHQWFKLEVVDPSGVHRKTVWAGVRGTIVVANCSLVQVFLWSDGCSLSQERKREKNVFHFLIIEWSIRSCGSPHGLYIAPCSVDVICTQEALGNSRAVSCGCTILRQSCRLLHPHRAAHGSQRQCTGSVAPRSCQLVLWGSSGEELLCPIVGARWLSVSCFLPTVSFPFRSCVCVWLRLVSGRPATENVSIWHWQVFLLRSLRRNPPAGDARDGVCSRSWRVLWGLFLLRQRSRWARSLRQWQALDTRSGRLRSISAARDARSGSCRPRKLACPPVGPDRAWQDPDVSQVLRIRGHEQGPDDFHADSRALRAAARDGGRTHTSIGSSIQRTQHAAWRESAVIQSCGQPLALTLFEEDVTAPHGSAQVWEEQDEEITDLDSSSEKWSSRGQRVRTALCSCDSKTKSSAQEGERPYAECGRRLLRKRRGEVGYDAARIVGEEKHILGRFLWKRVVVQGHLRMFSLIRRVRRKETDKRQLRTVDEDMPLAVGEQVVVSTSPGTWARGCWTVPLESMCLARTCQVALGHLTGSCWRLVFTRRRVLCLPRALRRIFSSGPLWRKSENTKIRGAISEHFAVGSGTNFAFTFHSHSLVCRVCFGRKSVGDGIVLFVSHPRRRIHHMYTLFSLQARWLFWANAGPRLQNMMMHVLQPGEFPELCFWFRDSVGGIEKWKAVRAQKMSRTVFTMGLVPASVERANRRHIDHRKEDVEAADGGSRQERISSAISFYGIKWCGGREGAILKGARHWGQAVEEWGVKKWEEGLPRLKEKNLEKTSRSYKVTRGLGGDQFHSKVSCKLGKMKWRKNVKFAGQVKQCGRWPQQACTTIFLIPNNVTSERSIALVPTLIWYRDGKNGIELGGMLPMCALDELLYGESCFQGEDLIMELAEWIGMDSDHAWPMRLGVSVLQLRGPGQRISNFWGRFCDSCVATSSTSGAFSSKGAWRSRSIPSRPSSLRRSGAACFYALCSKTPSVNWWICIRPWSRWLAWEISAPTWKYEMKSSEALWKRFFKGDEKGSVLKLSITEGGKEGIASCSLLLATSVER